VNNNNDDDDEVEEADVAELIDGRAGGSGSGMSAVCVEKDMKLIF
jgi:hypothetical protein